MSRILCLIDSLGAGGAERQLSYLAILMKEAGHEVKFVVFTKNHKFYEKFLLDGGIIPIYNEFGINRFRRILEIAKIVREFKPELTIAYKDGVCMSAILAKFLGQYNLVVSERSSTPNLTRLQKIKIFLFRFADHIVPNSYTQANLLKGFSQRLTSKIKVICNTIDKNSFTPPDIKKHNETPLIITTARVKKIKNILNYLMSISIIKEKGIKCRFEWYGKIDYGDTFPQEVKEEIKRLNITDYITFYPATNNVCDVYHKADIFCLPSLLEGFPNVICEAMSCELPIVCSNICDNPYIVEDGVNGYLFDPKNPKEIANILQQMIELSQSEREQMGKRNRNKIIQMCSPDKFMKSYLSLI